MLGKWNMLQRWQRRKLLHIGTGPIFILTWPGFTDDSNGAIWAAVVPFAMTVKFALVGLGYLRDDETVASASRSGDRRELLVGPLLYGLIFCAATLLFWKGAKAVICLFVLCFGDGFAEIGGRRYGKGNEWTHSPCKTVAGSISFVLASSTALVVFYLFWNTLVQPKAVVMDWAFVCRVLFDSTFAAAIESLPIDLVDNVTVFVAAIYADGVYLRLLTLIQQP